MPASASPPVHAAFDTRLKAIEQQVEQINVWIRTTFADSGWSTASLLNSWKALAGRTTPGWRRIGNTVHLRGQFGVMGASGSSAFVLPEALWPSVGLELTGSQYSPDGGVLVFVSVAGEVQPYYSGTPAQLSVDEVTYLLD
jgi:hypothetical protein